MLLKTRFGLYELVTLCFRVEVPVSIEESTGDLPPSQPSDQRPLAQQQRHGPAAQQRHRPAAPHAGPRAGNAAARASRTGRAGTEARNARVPTTRYGEDGDFRGWVGMGGGEARRGEVYGVLLLRPLLASAGGVHW